MESGTKKAHVAGAKNARIIYVGSRKSELALIQTNLVIKRLQDFYSNNPDKQSCLNPDSQSELSFQIVSMTTTGDRILDKPLPAIGTKSLFTGELEKELSEGRVDFVVHSLKDLPTTLPEGLTIGAVMKRDNPEDTIVLKKSLISRIDPLDLLMGRCSDPKIAKLKIGTSSQRRIAMIKKCNSNVECIDIRGNLNTRMSKLDREDGEYGAIILARAGLDRMNLTNRASCLLKPNIESGPLDWYYAVGQGAIAVECRSEDNFILNLLAPIVHLETTYEVVAERSVMKKLEAGCSVPLGVRSTWVQNGKDQVLRLEAIVLSVDGQRDTKSSGDVTVSDSERPDVDVSGLEMSAININVSKLKPSHSQVEKNMMYCSRVGVEIANKLIGSGCRDLLA